mgnify:CR=1 FL=1
MIVEQPGEGIDRAMVTKPVARSGRPDADAGDRGRLAFRRAVGIGRADAALGGAELGFAQVTLVERIELLVAGEPYFLAYMLYDLVQKWWLFVISIAIVLVVLWAEFRDWRGALFPLLWDPAARGAPAAEFARRFQARTTPTPNAPNAITPTIQGVN